MFKALKRKIWESMRLYGHHLHFYRRPGWKHGFTPSTIDVCGITKDNYKEFLTDKDYFLGHPYNYPYSAIIDNKLYLPLLLHNYKEYLPKYYFFIDHGTFLPLEDSEYFRKQTRTSVNAIIQLLQAQKILVLKHTHSSVGKGFKLIEYKDNGYTLNHTPITEAELKALLLSLNEYIVTEFIHQHSYAANICSTSLNTLRFVFVWDDHKQEFFLARSFHRFGCNGNIVDNIGSGNGILVFVDVENGTLLPEGSINEKHKGDKFKTNIVHPDHNTLLTGLTIPNFKEIKQKLQSIFNELSYLKYVGVDVAITETGFKIIEVNSLSSLDVTQQREGFLTDPRIRKVLKK